MNYKPFSFTLRGIDIFRYYVPLFFSTVLGVLLYTNLLKTFSYVSLGAMVLLLFFVLVYLIFLRYIIIDNILTNIIIDNEPVYFNGVFIRFFHIIVGRGILVILSLGIYYPWFKKRVTEYVVSHCLYKGEKPTFSGEPKSLLKKIVLIILFEIAVVIAMLFLLAAILNVSIVDWMLNMVQAVQNNDQYNNQYNNKFNLRGISLIMLYFLAKWTLGGIRLGNYRINVDNEEGLWHPCWYIFGEVFLSLITLFIYFPVAYTNILRRFCKRISFYKDDMLITHLNLEVRTFDAWKYMWGQILLSIISLGIYVPWAYCNIARFYVNHIESERPIMEEGVIFQE